MESLQVARRLVERSRKIVAFSGAGISTASGIPDFRSPGGVWSRHQPVLYQDFLASEDARRRYWLYRKEMYADFRNARPNAAHDALARMEERGRLEAVVTQNIDGLHQDAGNLKVVELHGTNRRVICVACGVDHDVAQVYAGLDAGRDVPVCDDCGGPLKAATISFGQNLDQDRLILHVGGDKDGALLSLDAATGATRWSLKGYGPGYASAVLAELDGVRQYVVQTQSHVIGVDAARGEALWTIPFTTPYEQNAVTAVASGGIVVYSGLDQGIHAVRPRRQGGRWTTDEAWRNDELAMYMSSPVLDGKHLFGFSHKKKGEFFCLDAETGRPLWRSEGRQGDNAALVAVGRDLLLLKDDAELVVIRMDAEKFTPVATYTVAQTATWAHPVPTAKGVLVKDLDSLALLRLE